MHEKKLNPNRAKFSKMHGKIKPEPYPFFKNRREKVKHEPHPFFKNARDKINMIPWCVTKKGYTLAHLTLPFFIEILRKI